MTQDQTRQLGIEFERRVREVIPSEVAETKLDTDTIYSFLNEFQDQYIKQLLLVDEKQNNKLANKVNEVIRSLTTNRRLYPIFRQEVKFMDKYDYINHTVYDLPDDYYQYIRSISMLDSSYKTGYKKLHFYKVHNILMSQKDIENIINYTYDENRIIRNPIAVLEGNKIKVITDRYTHQDLLILTYIKHPYRFNVLNYNDSDSTSNATHSYCELPYSCFDELVEGAVQLYLTYKTGGNQNKSQQKQQEDKS